MLQLGAGAVATVTFMIPSMIFITASFRPGRDTAILQALNDLGWIMVVMPWPPFMAQNYAFAYAILSDRSPEPVLPRWLGYLNLWAPIIYSPAILLPFFKLGPFDWRGIFVFFVPGVVFTIQFTANTLCLLKAIGTETPEAATTPPLMTAPVASSAPA